MSQQQQQNQLAFGCWCHDSFFDPKFAAVGTHALPHTYDLPLPGLVSLRAAPVSPFCPAVCSCINQAKEQIPSMVTYDKFTN